MKTTLCILVIFLATVFGAEPPPLLGANEAQLSERYGMPLYSKTEDGPFQRKLTYRVDDVTICASFLSGKAEVLDFHCESGINGVRVKQIFSRCGGEWKTSENGWTRKDGSSAEFSDGHFIVTSAAAVKARDEHERAKSNKSIKGL